MSTAGAALMTEDEIVEAMALRIAYAFDGVRGGRSAIAARSVADIALPWAREQALREAAETAHKWAIHGSDYRPSVVTEIEALIPARPSQETTEG